jgi:hypothetical protein
MVLIKSHSTAKSDRTQKKETDIVFLKECVLALRLPCIAKLWLILLQDKIDVFTSQLVYTVKMLEYATTLF